MSNPVFSLPSVRTYKDLRAAVRHGDAVIVKRIHHTVASRLATTYAEKSSPSPVTTNDLTNVRAKIVHRRHLTRDTFRVTAVVAGIGAAVWLSGETITTPALAMIALLPAVAIAAKSSELTMVFEAKRLEAAKVLTLRANVEARRRWLTTVSRSVKLIVRSFSNAQALYETRWFGSTGRVLRRHNDALDQIERINDSLRRAQKIEKIITSGSKPKCDLDQIVSSGWSYQTFFARRVLASAATAAFINTAILATKDRPLGALVAALVCATLLGARLAFTWAEIRLVERTIRRDNMRLRYPDLAKHLDESIEQDIESLIALYANGLDVDVDPFEDVEPQLRRQIDAAIASTERTTALATDVIDFESLREIHRPSAS